MGKAIANDPKLSETLKKYGAMTEELVNAAKQKPECMHIYAGGEIFNFRTESKFKNDAYIRSLPQVKRVWNLVLLSTPFDNNAGIKNLEMKEEHKNAYTIDHQFENSLIAHKQLTSIKICNVSHSDTPVAWIHGGQLPINPTTEWTELNDHLLVYGFPSEQNVIDVIKRVICGHRVAVCGDMKSERPKHIVITEHLGKYYANIKKELKKYGIGCSLSSKVPDVFQINGRWDGHVIVG